MSILDKIRVAMPWASSMVAYVPNITWELPSPSILGIPATLDLTPPIPPLALEVTLAQFGFNAEVIATHCGPTSTLFELRPIGSSSIKSLKATLLDVSIRLGTHGLHYKGPIPGSPAIGIEVTHDKPTTVPLASLANQLAGKSIPIPLGIGHDGKPIVLDLIQAPHILVAGTTGSGKSVFINSFIASCLINNTPDDIQFVLIDPKMVEFQKYKGIPHLLMDVITDVNSAVEALYVMERYMDDRFNTIAQAKCANIEEYNSNVPHGEAPLNRIVIVIDEFADLIMQNSLVETPVVRIAQKARAAGMHLVIATQRPVVKVVTGLIKANISTRISFRVPSGIDSRVILDQKGAETLRGQGDLMALTHTSSSPIRAQAPILQNEHLKKLLAHWRPQDKFLAPYR